MRREWWIKVFGKGKKIMIEHNASYLIFFFFFLNGHLAALLKLKMYYASIDVYSESLLRSR